MDRSEFSTILNRRRQELPRTYVDLTVQTGLHSQILQNIILGRTNVFVDTVLQLLPSLKLNLEVHKDGKTVQIKDNNSLTQWAKNSFENSNISRTQFANKIGLHRNSLPTHLDGTSKMRIDTFLKWANYTDWNIELQS